MAAEVNKKLSNIIECSICMEIFTDSRMLPCIHTFCAKCLSETGSKSKKGPGDKMPCPLCRTEFTVPMDGFTGLKKNFFVDKFVEVIQLSSKQNACHSNTGKCSSAKWYCHECKQKLCDECFKLHKEIKTLKHHNLVPIDDQTDSKKLMEFCNATVCDQHETEELKVFCDDCQVVQCALCLLERHQSHKWSYVKEVANKFRTQIVSNADMLSGSVPEAQRIIEQLDKDNIEFLETVIKIESEVNEKKLRIKALFEEIVDEEARSLLLKLSSYKQAKSKESGIEKEDIDGHVTELNSYIMFCSEITAKGSDVDICRAVNDLNSRAKELKESHGTVMQRTPASRRRPISFEERKSEDFLKTCGNLLGKIEGTHQNMPSSQHQQQSSVLYSQQNPPQVVMHGMQGNVYMRPYVVQPGSMMNAQLPQAPQQTAQAIRQSMMMQPRFPGQMPPYQQQPQQQQPGFVQQEQQHYSQMLPPDSNYHLATAGSGMHPTYYHAMPVQQQVPQRSDGAMPGNPLPPQVFAAGGQMQQPNAQQWQMYQQAQALQRFQSLFPVRFPQQMPVQRMMPATMPQPGMPQEMPTEAVARPPMHVGEPTQRPPLVPRPPRSDIVYYDPVKNGNDSHENSSQAAKHKVQNVIATTDPTTRQNVLETLEMSSRRTSNEALRFQSEFASKVSKRISRWDEAARMYSTLDKVAQPPYDAQPKDFFAIAPAATLDKKQESVEEKMREKSQKKSEDKTEQKSKKHVSEKTQERMQEKTQEQIQENMQDIMQEPIPVGKKFLMEKEETQQNPALVAEQLHLQQEISKVAVADVVHSEIKDAKMQTAMPYAIRSQIIESTEHSAGAIASITDLPHQLTALNRDCRRVYSRDLLLQLQFLPASLETPHDFADFPEIVRRYRK